jgi:hypothetical protein
VKSGFSAANEIEDSNTMVQKSATVLDFMPEMLTDTSLGSPLKSNCGPQSNPKRFEGQ